MKMHTSKKIKDHIRGLKQLEESMKASIEATKVALPTFNDEFGPDLLLSIQESKYKSLLALINYNFKPWFWESEVDSLMKDVFRLDSSRSLLFSTRMLSIKTAQLRASRK